MKDIITIIFSKDRALQADLTLKTFHARCQDPELTDVVLFYTTSSNSHQKSYVQLEKEWGFDIDAFIEIDFREDLLSLLEDRKYVLFIVDDCIFTHDFSLEKISKNLEHWQRFGFSLRLGKNTTHCYTMNTKQKFPADPVKVEENILSYCWDYKSFDFGYPAEVSSSMYRVDTFMDTFKAYDFRNPNELESLMASIATTWSNKMPFLLCYEQSVAFCNPCNKVQTVAPNNRAGMDIYYTPENLLSLYTQGVRIDPEMFHGFVSNSTHMEVSLIHD